MRSAILTTLALALTIPVVAYEHGNHVRIHDGHDRNITVHADDWKDLTSCDQISVTIDGKEAARDVENVNVSSFRSIKLRATHDPVYVAGGADTYSVKLCKAAALASDLATVHAKVSGNEISVDGNRDNEDVVTFFLVRTPRNADIDVDSTNGPISLRDVDGNISAHALNGPIGVKQSAGTISITTENGPISFAGGRGRVTLAAHNGPISVKLDGAAYDGTLDARADNGPLSLKVPPRFNTGIVVETDGHGPISCKAEQCRGMAKWDPLRDDDRPRRIELGSGTQNVRLTTKNGPVSIKERAED